MSPLYWLLLQCFVFKWQNFGIGCSDFNFLLDRKEHPFSRLTAMNSLCIYCAGLISLFRASGRYTVCLPEMLLTHKQGHHRTQTKALYFSPSSSWNQHIQMRTHSLSHTHSSGNRNPHIVDGLTVWWCESDNPSSMLKLIRAVQARICGDHVSNKNLRKLYSIVHSEITLRMYLCITRRVIIILLDTRVLISNCTKCNEN